MNKQNNLSTEEFNRFISNVIKNKCWEWSGKKDKDGYGVFFLRRKLRRAHRVSYYAFLGMIAPKMVIHHKCSNRACVNPRHLEQRTALENRLLWKKDFCKYGHKFDRKYGKQRYCSLCQKNKTKRLREKWKLEPQLAGI